MTPACVNAAVSEGFGVSVGFGALVHAINTDSDKNVVSERVSAFMVILLVMNTPLACVRFHIAIETKRLTLIRRQKIHFRPRVIVNKTVKFSDFSGKIFLP